MVFCFNLGFDNLILRLMEATNNILFSTTKEVPLSGSLVNVHLEVTKQATRGSLFLPIYSSVALFRIETTTSF